MIHTLTLNPSVDVTFTVGRIELGAAQRVSDPIEYAGGKGMNVSTALHALGLPSVAWVWIGGDRGEHWKRLARRLDVPLEVISVLGETRQNIKINEAEGPRTTDLNLPGPSFDPVAGARLLSQIASRFRRGDFLVLAGSAPQNTPDYWWKDLVHTVNMTHSRLIVDTTGQALAALEAENPWAIKINRREFNELKRTDYGNLEEIALEIAGKKSRSHLLLTDGEQGALACPADGGRPLRVAGVPAHVRGTVGAGDAFTAGFLAGWIEENENWEEALRMGIAAATAAVEIPGTSFGSRERVLEKRQRL